MAAALAVSNATLAYAGEGDPLEKDGGASNPPGNPPSNDPPSNEPPSNEPPSLAAPPLASTPPAPPASPEPQEVRIRGGAASRPQKTMARSDVRQMPGAMGDPLRAIEVLPGVSPTVSGLPYFYIRGAPPNTTGFMLDDIRLPYLFHVGLGPSILHPALVRSVSVESGGGAPRYGHQAGSFIAATTTTPSEATTWEGRLRVIDASAFVEAPFADGKGHVAVGGTASFADLLLGVFAPDYTIDYRDYSTRLTYDLGPRDHLTLFSLGSYDFASQRDNGQDEVLFASEIYRVDLKWTHDLPDHGEFRAGTTWGYDRSRLVGKRFARDQSLDQRFVLRQPFARQWEFETGAEARLDSYDADLPSPYSLTPADYAETARIFSNHDDTVTGAYVNLRWRPSSMLDLSVGGRGDVYTSQGHIVPAVEPRTSLAFAPSKRVRFSTAYGVAHQPPAYLIPIPAVSIAGLPGGLQESLQSSVTAEVTGPLDIVASATAFRGVFSNLSDFVLIQSDFPLKASPGLHGVTNGLELAAKRPLRNGWGMQISYTLSRSVRDANGEPERLSSYDRTHVLNVALLFDLGKGWTAGARVLTYTGLLRDPDSGSTERLPAFTRLDARIAKRWKWGRGYFGVVAEALNATAASETVALRCDDQKCTPRVIGPLTMPSLGLEGGM